MKLLVRTARFWSIVRRANQKMLERPIVEFVKVDDTRIAFDRSGSGEPIVLLHAGIGDRRMWNDQVAALSDQFEVIRIDARGFGDSVRTEMPYSAHSDVVTVLDALEVSKAHLLGESMGSSTALEVVSRAPERVRSLTLVSCGVGAPPSDDLLAGWAEVERLLNSGDIDGANELEMQMWIDGPGRSSSEVDPKVRAWAAEMNRELLVRKDQFESAVQVELPIETLLPAIACPSLVICGDQDIPSVQQASTYLAAKIPGAQLTIMENCAHLPQLEKPEEFSRILVDFLGSVSGR
jgi:3-oxoadipate enol-lactonase